jgi:hypothetical protein
MPSRNTANYYRTVNTRVSKDQVITDDPHPREIELNTTADDDISYDVDSLYPGDNPKKGYDLDIERMTRQKISNNNGNGNSNNRTGRNKKSSTSKIPEQVRLTDTDTRSPNTRKKRKDKERKRPSPDHTNSKIKTDIHEYKNESKLGNKHNHKHNHNHNHIRQDEVPPNKFPVRHLIVIIAVLLVIGLGTAIFFLLNRSPRKRYPECYPIQESDLMLAKLGDGKCDRGDDDFTDDYMAFGLNSEECGYDHGDCNEWNDKYMNCFPDMHPSELTDLGKSKWPNQFCNVEYNTAECGFDDGKCIEFNQLYPGCKTAYSDKLGDKWCDYNDDLYTFMNTEECKWDGGDCIHPDFPLCTGIDPNNFYNNRCDPELNREECNYDNGECDLFNQQYPNCEAPEPWTLGDGECTNDPQFNNDGCNFDGGDCIAFNAKYPGCNAEITEYVGDGYCHNDPLSYNSEACEFDGGDCIDFNNNTAYATCDVFYAGSLGNGKCENMVYYERFKHNVEQCAFDGGDCVDFNQKYPECDFVLFPERVGDGVCDYGPTVGSNTAECEFDGGDCTEFNLKYPECDTYEPQKIGDGYCDWLHNNKKECDFDGGDCRGD